MTKVKDILNSLDVITGGRIVKGPMDYAGANPFVVTKTSGIPGKAVTEMPGLVWGNPEMPVKKVGILMTLTESAIELAGATGVDCLIAHHPLAEAANSGGVTFKNYLDLYHLAVFELHEAFHGLHPGIAWIHGSKAEKVNIKFGGVPGKIVWYGKSLPEVNTLGQLLTRIDTIMGTAIEQKMLEKEREVRCCQDIQETSIAARAKIFVGKPENELGNTITVFPHTGFSPEDLEQAYKEYPCANTVVCTISRPLPDDALVRKAAELGLNLVAGNSHALEILENGIPLAWALHLQHPELDIRIFRERMVSLPLEHCGCQKIEKYGENIAKKYLPKKD